MDIKRIIVSRTDKIGDCAKQKYERFDVSKDLDKSFKLMFFNKS